MISKRQERIDLVTYARDTAIAKYDNIRDQLDAITAQPDLVDNPRVERINLDTQLANVIQDAEHINKTIDANDYDIAKICFVCVACGAYANDRTSNGQCLCDDGCGLIGFDMIVL